MRKTLLALLLIVGTLGIVAPRVASAQADAAVVKVPFKFIVGERLMPAGNYRITSDERDRTLLTLTPVDGKGVAVFAQTNWQGSGAAAGKVEVQFKNIDGHYFLSQVAMPGADTRAVKLTKADAERVLARLNLMPAERADVAK